MVKLNQELLFLKTTNYINSYFIREQDFILSKKTNAGENNKIITH